MLHNASLITGYVTADGVHNQENMQLSSDPFPRERVWSEDDRTPHTMIPQTMYVNSTEPLMWAGMRNNEYCYVV